MTTGGDYNLAIGHDHKFYGKESLALHDGNIVGAKGFYWKAIDTTEKKIYLTKTQPTGDNRCCPITADSQGIYKAAHPEYNVPYFGPKADSAHQELFQAENGIGLSGSQLSWKYITVVNVW